LRFLFPLATSRTPYFSSGRLSIAKLTARPTC
jgi:hypothetical protein